MRGVEELRGARGRGEWPVLITDKGKHSGPHGVELGWWEERYRWWPGGWGYWGNWDGMGWNSG